MKSNKPRRRSSAAWEIREAPLGPSPAAGICLQLFDATGQPMSVQAAVVAWINDPAFGTFCGAALAAVPYPAFRWELPAVDRGSAPTQPWECVVLPSPELQKPAEAEAFAEHFAGLDPGDVATFPNLSGDAVLVVPGPGGAAGTAPAEAEVYAHLGAFLRGASSAQQARLWQALGRALAGRLNRSPVWLNTAGAGVPWLHIRLDSRPKYYRHAPYRQGTKEERER